MDTLQADQSPEVILISDGEEENDVAFVAARSIIRWVQHLAADNQLMDSQASTNLSGLGLLAGFG